MNKSNYILSTGETTNDVITYIKDLFKIYFSIRPKDIPGMGYVGFESSLIGITKDSLRSEITRRVQSVVDIIKSQFTGIEMSLESLKIISEERIDVVLNIDGNISEVYYIGYEN